MDLYLIAHQHIDHAMREQFREEPEPREDAEPVAPRAGIITTLRLNLSADLRALAATIEPRPLTPEPRASNR